MTRIPYSVFIASLMSVAVFTLGGCEDYPGYPHNEQPTHADDNYKSGEGYYGGVTRQDADEKRPGGPMSTAPFGSTKPGTMGSTTPPGTATPGMTDTGTYGNNSAGGSNAGQNPNNGTAPTQDGGSH